MSEKHSGRAEKRSQLYLQNLINKYPEIFDSELSKQLGREIKVNWVSPIEADNYREYRDSAFLKKLGIKNICDSQRPLSDFWPDKGAHWDALGKFDSQVFIVEAKGHIEEIVSPGTGATDPNSLKQIQAALQETKKFLRIKSEYDWSKTLYQYANRLAHLYYLRECCKIDAFLIFLYFTNDTSWDDYGTEYGWKCAELVVHKILGIPAKNKLSKYIRNIYIDVDKLI